MWMDTVFRHFRPAPPAPIHATFTQRSTGPGWGRGGTLETRSWLPSPVAGSRQGSRRGYLACDPVRRCDRPLASICRATHKVPTSPALGRTLPFPTHGSVRPTTGGASPSALIHDAATNSQAGPRPTSALRLRADPRPGGVAALLPCGLLSTVFPDRQGCQSVSEV